MDLSEKEVEDFIYNDLIDNNGAGLSVRGLELQSMYAEMKVLWYRQFSIEPYGIPDIVGFYRGGFGHLCVELIELKKVEIHPDHFEQILRYKKGLSVYLKNTFPSAYIEINCTLIGSAYKGFYLQNSCPVDVASFTFDLSGLQFDFYQQKSNWHIPVGENKSFRKPKHNGQKVY